MGRFREVRAETERRADLLSPEDQVVQSMPDASPTKWHRAHVTWFFEQFLLKPYAKNYTAFDERFAYLYNSYYVSAGPRAARPQRGLITRPSAAEVGAYRAHVDDAVAKLIGSADAIGEIIPIVEIGINHEQQHQELLLTDILHAFSLNETHPAYDPDWQWPLVSAENVDDVIGGIDTIGHDGDGFCFDNEQPAHQILLKPVRLSARLVTNRDWLDFMADGGYTTPTLWLSDGWTTVEAQGWSAPGYWRKIDGAWFAMTLGGLRRVEPNRPVCHVSYYEADAFARWSGMDLPTEAEWEVAARRGVLADAFGVAWQWTRSAYSPYPGYKAAPGALGEYNGKFMINQMVLRGSSLATPVGHSRLSYRNFFYPSARWQFSGLRLAAYQH
ncbi:MAG TPA: ergothioneine biosynthesis protein EgtB [Xanthobacteraceae bacterium]|nr:ergothioneine biosynthesis protein EgtB [Xanthobacteraceae bacterium]